MEIHVVGPHGRATIGVEPVFAGIVIRDVSCHIEDMPVQRCQQFRKLDDLIATLKKGGITVIEDVPPGNPDHVRPARRSNTRKS